MIAYVWYPGSKGALNPTNDSLIKTLHLIGTLLGQLLFGILGDMLGRKKMYGIELILLIIGALGQAFAFSHGGLSIIAVICFWRFILGFGIGGDYPVSAVIASEFSSKKDRGKVIALVFSMQGMGILLGCVVSVAVLAGFKDMINNDINAMDYVWRILAGFGCVPALAALYFRLTMPESPRYAIQVQKDLEKGTTDIKNYIDNKAGVEAVQSKKGMNQEQINSQWCSTFKNYFGQWKHLKVLLGCSFSWFFVDIGYYGTNLNTSIILNAIGYSNTTTPFLNVWTLTIGTIIVTLAGLIPGFYVTVGLIDVIGRKTIQLLGFVLLTILMLILATAYYNMQHTAIWAFIMIYCLVQFFFNFGPNSTTFIIPSEAFPTRVRTTAHGIAAATGKAGAILGAQAFSRIANIGGKNVSMTTVLGIFTACMFLGLMSTFWVPETKNMTLEEIEEESEKQTPNEKNIEMK